MVRKVNKRNISSPVRSQLKADAAISSNCSEIEKHLLENAEAAFIIECSCGCGMLNCSRLRNRSDGKISLLQIVNHDFSFNMSLQIIN